MVDAENNMAAKKFEAVSCLERTALENKWGPNKLYSVVHCYPGFTIFVAFHIFLNFMQSSAVTVIFQLTLLFQLYTPLP